MAGKAEVVLPGVAQQHSERHLVVGAELLRSEEEVWDLGEALCTQAVTTPEDNVALFEDVSDVPGLAELHASIVTDATRAGSVVPC